MQKEEYRYGVKEWSRLGEYSKSWHGKQRKKRKKRKGFHIDDLTAGHGK
jgi:hypothetical protein